MLYCSSECGSISIMHAQLRTIYCNTYVYAFHVCLCLLALTFVCNSTYLLKCSFQIYRFEFQSLLLFATYTGCPRKAELLRNWLCILYKFFILLNRIYYYVNGSSFFGTPCTGCIKTFIVKKKMNIVWKVGKLHRVFRSFPFKEKLILKLKYMNVYQILCFGCINIQLRLVSLMSLTDLLQLARFLAVYVGVTYAYHSWKPCNGIALK